MNLRAIGRVAGILGTTLTVLVGIISIALGSVSTTAEQGGGSLVVRGSILVALSIVAGYATSIRVRKPGLASLLFVVVAVLGSVTAFRSFWMASSALIIAALIAYTNRER